MDRLIDFRGLVQLGVLKNRVTLARWVEREGFPPGQLIGLNSRRWRESEISAWIASRPVRRAKVERQP